MIVVIVSRFTNINSDAGHENGVRHKKNVADKITEIKKQQAASTQVMIMIVMDW